MARTGADYLKSLDRRDCAIFIGGRKVGDVRTDAAFAPGCESIARLYDRAADPAFQNELTFVDPENGKRYNNIWLKPRSLADLDARNRVHRAWADMSWGLFGRSPDHVAGWITGMACNATAETTGSERYAENIRQYYQYARERDLFVTYAIVLPSAAKVVNARVAGGDTSAVGQFANGMRVIDEQPGGLVVSGFKVLVTAGAIADEIMFGNWQPLPPGQEKLATTFALPVNTKGLTLISRRPYAANADSKLDDPLASRFDETDCIVYLDNVLVPWDRVFTYNSTERAMGVFNDTPAHALGNAQAHVRLLSKMRLMLGAIKLMLQHNGLIANPAVKDTVARLAVDVSILEALVTAENAQFETWPGGYVSQSRQMMYATMAWTQELYPAFVTTIRELLASHSFQQPANISVFDNPETAELYSLFMQRPVKEAFDHYKLARLLWDLVGTEFASRHTQYEMFYNGPQHVNRMRLYSFFPWKAVDEHAEAALRHIGSFDELVRGRGPALKVVSDHQAPHAGKK